MYKAIIFDLDGTLAESKQVLSPKMGEALEKLLSKLPVGVMSGADFPQFEKQFLPFIPHGANQYNLFLFPTSAAECKEYRVNGSGRPEWATAYDYLFNTKDKDKILSAIKEVEEKTGFVRDAGSYGPRVEDRGEQITWSALGQDAPLEEKEKWDPDHNKRQIMRQELLQLIPEFEISIGGATSIDILNKGIDKTRGIDWLKTKLGCEASDMLYVGDALFEGGNDSVVNRTGIQTKQVSGPIETQNIIESLL